MKNELLQLVVGIDVVKQPHAADVLVRKHLLKGLEIGVLDEADVEFTGADVVHGLSNRQN